MSKAKRLSVLFALSLPTTFAAAAEGCSEFWPDKQIAELQYMSAEVAYSKALQPVPVAA